VSPRREQLRALAGFVPDCAILCARLLRDRRVPRRHKALVAGLVGYLSLPLDLVPDFLPLVGQLDDALAVALVLRRLSSGVEPLLLEELWPGPRASLQLVLRLAGRSAP
jgi:uncharacterized membrane protein YkvA (DUF1232 family)